MVTTAQELATEWDAARKVGAVIGYVPTMGALHEGHLSLVDLARDECDVVICSIFVNPLQFGLDEDFESYPRPVERDLGLLEARGTSIAFLPSWTEIFPGRERVLEDFGTHVAVPRLSHQLCGRSRAGHFDGMVTESLLFLNLVRPDRTYWGEKDFQQLRIIETLVQDLRLPVTVVRGATRREPDGLAMSSRNKNLTPEARAVSPNLRRVLQEARAELLAGQPLPAVRATARQELTDLGFVVEYLVACEEGSLSEVSTLDTPLAVRLFAAAMLQGVRLLDSIPLTEANHG
ncbi:pantoate--beta-alanine ligase [Streptomyces sp. ISL-10]|uniref:pantoate--beta-alanine ligase n=1 Tax=Streptomyces sp. ISL-10 TaxID=2819172 RepID=UPI001BE6F888|nr:pantoate--beta-alanine ligase [Streptomyces sp. ISL-10]MBT2363974.1 pantoate--beta-alanine ligase [Streptomyces sp. ISL-10]